MPASTETDESSGKDWSAAKSPEANYFGASRISVPAGNTGRRTFTCKTYHLPPQMQARNSESRCGPQKGHGYGF